MMAQVSRCGGRGATFSAGKTLPPYLEALRAGLGEGSSPHPRPLAHRARGVRFPLP
ncbi:MAG: hypothetical protein ANABAC_1791 [Anaerolineae bacterium]|nr:MAG: hypothetical protein ANABAC_1791 [Anaerolineae bacterium]